MKMLRRLWKDESGATAIEYGLIASLIVIGIIVSVQAIGTNYVSGPLVTVSNHLTR